MKVALITSIINGIDNFIPVPPQTIKFDRITLNGSEDFHPFMSGCDARLKAKFGKMLIHQAFNKYDYFIWIDGNVEILSEKFIEHIIFANGGENNDSHININKHPARKDIYEEARFILDEIRKGNQYLMARYNNQAIRKEIINDIGAGYELNGLYYCGIFGRPNSHKVNRMMEKWFLKNVLGSNFDQLNFVQLADIFEIKLYPLNMYANGREFYHNSFYKLHGHKKLQ